MKTMFLSLLLFTVLFGLNAFAQEEKPDVMPEPIGGIEAIMNNVVYPDSAKEEGVQGKVIVKLIVDEKGKVSSIEVVQSVNKELDEAAVIAINKTKFTPAMKD
ncbi:MAG TPA: energy transducer TonB, partial [Ignavibacteriaceae bacterium]|nr:energy transducer TonB [Ignavibacteriaceae bacterium]